MHIAQRKALPDPSEASRLGFGNRPAFIPVQLFFQLFHPLAGYANSIILDRQDQVILLNGSRQGKMHCVRSHGVFDNIFDQRLQNQLRHQTVIEG
ncbi:hypothetical protein D3C73_1181350 [compost metagenome]